MTAQKADIIYINAKQYPLFTNPLEDFWGKGNAKPPFYIKDTSCWRGYIASWEIIDDVLFLVDIELYMGDTTIADVFFPKITNKLKAVWFTGELRIPLGDRLENLLGGYDAIYDSDWLIQVEKGEVKQYSYKANY